MPNGKSESLPNGDSVAMRLPLALLDLFVRKEMILTLVVFFGVFVGRYI